MLWWFLRRIRATLIIAVAIPISLFTTFIMLGLTGRTLNVISLAGLAFAVGMVLDAAIVVVENVVRLRERGLSASEASLQGAAQVWGALLASTATTVAIFLPVLFMREVEGQLFADLAITIAIAVIVSTLVAVTVMPLAAQSWLRDESLQDPNAGLWQRITAFVMRVTSTLASAAQSSPAWSACRWPVPRHCCRSWITCHRSSATRWMPISGIRRERVRAP